MQGSFNKCTESLKLLRNENIKTSVITTVNKQNIKELPLIRDFLLDRGIAW